jgi:hypothetical protein
MDEYSPVQTDHGKSVDTVTDVVLMTRNLPCI